MAAGAPKAGSRARQEVVSNTPSVRNFTHDAARQHAKEAFTRLGEETSSLDVLERCKKLNEFLSTDFMRGGGPGNKADLQHILALLNAKPKRPAFLDTPPVISQTSPAPTQPGPPRGLDHLEAEQLLDVISAEEHTSCAAEPSTAPVLAAPSQGTPDVPLPTAQGQAARKTHSSQAPLVEADVADLIGLLNASSPQEAAPGTAAMGVAGKLCGAASAGQHIQAAAPAQPGHLQTAPHVALQPPASQDVAEGSQVVGQVLRSTPAKTKQYSGSGQQSSSQTGPLLPPPPQSAQPKADAPPSAQPSAPAATAPAASSPAAPASPHLVQPQAPAELQASTRPTGHPPPQTAMQAAVTAAAPPAPKAPASAPPPIASPAQPPPPAPTAKLMDQQAAAQLSSGPQAPVPPLAPSTGPSAPHPQPSTPQPPQPPPSSQSPAPCPLLATQPGDPLSPECAPLLQAAGRQDLAAAAAPPPPAAGTPSLPAAPQPSAVASRESQRQQQLQLAQQLLQRAQHLKQQREAETAQLRGLPPPPAPAAALQPASTPPAAVPVAAAELAAALPVTPAPAPAAALEVAAPQPHPNPPQPPPAAPAALVCATAEPQPARGAPPSPAEATTAAAEPGAALATAEADRGAAAAGKPPPAGYAAVAASSQASGAATPPTAATAIAASKASNSTAAATPAVAAPAPRAAATGAAPCPALVPAADQGTATTQSTHSAGGETQPASAAALALRASSQARAASLIQRHWRAHRQQRHPNQPADTGGSQAHPPPSSSSSSSHSSLGTGAVCRHKTRQQQQQLQALACIRQQAAARLIQRSWRQWRRDSGRPLRPTSGQRPPSAPRTPHDATCSSRPASSCSQRPGSGGSSRPGTSSSCCSATAPSRALPMDQLPCRPLSATSTSHTQAAGLPAPPRLRPAARAPLLASKTAQAAAPPPHRPPKLVRGAGLVTPPLPAAQPSTPRLQPSVEPDCGLAAAWAAGGAEVTRQRVVSASRARSSVQLEGEEVRRSQLGKRVVMAASTHRAHAQVVAIIRTSSCRE